MLKEHNTFWAEGEPSLVKAGLKLVGKNIRYDGVAEASAGHADEPGITRVFDSHHASGAEPVGIWKRLVKKALKLCASFRVPG